jgi:hypothetical protein
VKTFRKFVEAAPQPTGKLVRIADAIKATHDPTELEKLKKELHDELFGGLARARQNRNQNSQNT